MSPRQAPGPVLVVDDEDSIRSLLGLLVKRAGAESVAVGTVREARELAERGDFSLALAIIDKNLPDGNGLELLSWLREKAPDVPVMLVTGYGSAEAASEALRLGAFDYVLKPFEIAWVTRRIAIALEHRRMRDQLARARAALPRGLEAVAAELG